MFDGDSRESDRKGRRERAEDLALRHDTYPTT